MIDNKDIWDKAEICGKVIGAILIPIVVGASVFHWNTERTRRNTTAAMLEIAVGIIEKPRRNDYVGPEPLRQWAVDVLMSPTSPPPITPEVADRLLRDEIGFESELLYQAAAEIAAAMQADFMMEWLRQHDPEEYERMRAELAKPLDLLSAEDPLESITAPENQ
ncbi:hypothetical protein [Pseudooceanicola marinus]|uniref:hypothetical protein n=1 Tax=Pseudooceanicola marinus TaxID=396013 RepID=UPI001CD33563|nr:hypothetical protein [Pseudooceanicola marinus]MCA1337474.1 hypothetical protein [Pseudooceanicola marinus]